MTTKKLKGVTWASIFANQLCDKKKLCVELVKDVQGFPKKVLLPQFIKGY